MKKLGISLDGVIRDYHASFDKQYRKVYIDNPTLVNMDEEFKYKKPSEEDIEDKALKIAKEIDDRISLPVDTSDLLNHYQFDEEPEFQNENAFTTPEDSEFRAWDMELEMEDRILSPEEALNRFMYEKYPFKIFGDAEEFSNAMSYFNRIQAYGLRNNLFETVLISDLKSNSITSNFYFLHKAGSRARNFQIVMDEADKWNYCDVLIDVSPETFQSKPDGKIAIKVERPYNQWDETDYTVKSLKEVNDEKFISNFF